MTELEQYYTDPDTLTEIIQSALKQIEQDKGNRHNMKKLELLAELNEHAKRIIIRREKKL